MVVLTAGFPEPGRGGSSGLCYHSGSPSFPEEKQAGSAWKGLRSNLLLMEGLVLRSYQLAQGFTQFSTESPQRWMCNLLGLSVPGFGCHSGKEIFPCNQFQCLFFQLSHQTMYHHEEFESICSGTCFLTGHCCYVPLKSSSHQALPPLTKQMLQSPTLLVVYHFSFPIPFLFWGRAQK